jgi:hypothetical protein
MKPVSYKWVKVSKDNQTNRTKDKHTPEKRLRHVQFMYATLANCAKSYKSIMWSEDVYKAPELYNNIPERNPFETMAKIFCVLPYKTQVKFHRETLITFHTRQSRYDMWWSFAKLMESLDKDLSAKAKSRTMQIFAQE